MTEEQAINFLTNKKVFVKNKSSEIQEKLFSLGIYWSGKCSIQKCSVFIHRNEVRYNQNLIQLKC